MILDLEILADRYEREQIDREFMQQIEDYEEEERCLDDYDDELTAMDLAEMMISQYNPADDFNTPFNDAAEAA